MLIPAIAAGRYHHSEGSLRAPFFIRRRAFFTCQPSAHLPDISVPFGTGLIASAPAIHHAAHTEPRGQAGAYLTLLKGT